MAKVSVIIPCYNQAQFVGDAIESVLAQTYRDFEIIVVNDGSTDPQTNSILESYTSPLIRVVSTDNQGVANARNNGISAASGLYILPLDADDKIASSYMEKAVSVLDANPNVGIVYCEAEFFGEKTEHWELPEYKFPDILLGNVIFCSALYRKSDWQEAKGYNPNMTYGYSDYDFWLSLIELGREVFRIPERLFFYRKRAGSMNSSITREQLIYLYTQLFRNHPALYSENIDFIFRHIVELGEQLRHAIDRVRELEGRLDLLPFDES